MGLNPNSVDITIFFIIFVFAFLGFLKGFIKDLFSTANLILATIISFLLGPIVTELFASSSYPQMFIDLGVRFGLFVVVLIILSIITSRISDPLSDKIPGAINKTLGFGFGFTKGYLIIAFIFALFLSLYVGTPKADKNGEIHNDKIGPSWFANSRSYDFLIPGAEMLKPFVEEQMEKIKNNAIGGSSETLKKNGKEGSGTIDEILKSKELYDNLDNGEEKAISPEKEVIKEREENAPAAEEESGQTKQEIEKMKRLIEIMGN